jgi:hypothetical protein
MAITDASQTRLAYIVETTEGVTPATPVFKNLRYTSESLTRTAEKIVSEEIRADRNVSDLIAVGRMASGNIQAELSDGTFEDLLEGLMMGTWATDVLKNGSTRKSFTFEKTFEIGANDAYIRYIGCLINTLEMNISAKEIVKTNFGVMGRGGSSGSSIISGATYTAAGTDSVFNASAHVGELTVSGMSPTPVIRALTLNINNNLREQPKVGALDLAGVGLGRFEVTGSMEVYFEDLAIYNAIHNNDTLGLKVTIGPSAGTRYTIEIPSLKIMDGEPVAGGNNQDVMLPIQFRGIYNSGQACTLKITRNV